MACCLHHRHVIFEQITNIYIYIHILVHYIFPGIFGLIIGGLLVLYTQVTLTFISPAPFIPISTGIIFLIIWWQVKDVFCAVRIENYPR